MCQITIASLAYLPRQAKTLGASLEKSWRWDAESECSFTGVQDPLIPLPTSGKGLERTMSLFRWKYHLQGNRHMIKVCFMTPIVTTKNVSHHITELQRVKKDPTNKT